jgi:hypothetical protein
MKHSFLYGVEVYSMHPVFWTDSHSLGGLILAFWHAFSPGQSSTEHGEIRSFTEEEGIYCPVEIGFPRGSTPLDRDRKNR